MFKHKILLITGGTGSFGTAVLRRFLETEIREIRIFSRDEEKQDRMRQEWKDSRIKYFIGDVRDKSSLDYAMNGCDYVFHAAALKQIPSTENFPMEAVKTNIIGTDHVLEKAIQYNVAKVICLSTDKSVYPISAMGISKSMMEKIIVARARMSQDTVITCARYGNVMASRGSVIPLFVAQIKKGEPITVTDPSMSRFMMSLEDAVELVLFAFDNGKPGDIFVQKAPSATIGQLASVLGSIFGAKNEVVTIGKRNGDKLHETLVTKEEFQKAEDLGNYFRIPADVLDLSYTAATISETKINPGSEGYQSNHTKLLTESELKQLLLNLPFIQEQIIKK